VKESLAVRGQDEVAVGAALEVVPDREAGELLDAVEAERPVVAGGPAEFIAGDRRYCTAAVLDMSVADR